MGVAATSQASTESVERRVCGRYVLHAPIAHGGMATIHLAHLVGSNGFTRVVAAKCLHPQFAEDPEFVTMFRDEAEIASKIHHPNVVSVLDIVVTDQEVVLVQEYVHGVSLDRLSKAARVRGEPVPVEVAVAVMAGVLAGLHAAHETTDESGVPLGIIHRDMSPQNIMVGLDGIPRLLDFGIAKARSSAHVTRAGMIKGKFAYMAPEQVAGHVSRRSDVYACGVVLWELLSQRKPHTGKTEVELLSAVVHEPIPSLTSVLEGGRANMAPARWEKIARVDAVVARAVDRTPENRFASAAQMLDALLHVCPAAAPATVTAWVQANGGEYLERGKQLLAATDGSARSVSGIALTGHPAGHRSGVTRIGSEPSTSMHWDLVSSSMVSSNAELLAAANRGRLAPWLIAGGSLLVTGILIGTLLIHRGAPAAPAFSATTGPPPKADAIAQVVQAPSPTVLAPTTSPVAKSVSEAPEARAPVAVRPIRYPAQTSAPAPRRAPSAPTMSGAETAEPMASPMAPSTPGPKTDCDPPFYFEGSKKVFKRGCI